jgi:hypothetical protein
MRTISRENLESLIDRGAAVTLVEALPDMERQPQVRGRILAGGGARIHACEVFASFAD